MSLSAGRPSKASKQATLADMTDKKSVVRVNFDLDSEAYKRLKIYCVEHEKSVRQVLTELIQSLNQ